MLVFRSAYDFLSRKSEEILGHIQYIRLIIITRLWDYGLDSSGSRQNVGAGSYEQATGLRIL
jgi:hypothetical protein